MLWERRFWCKFPKKLNDRRCDACQITLTGQLPTQQAQLGPERPIGSTQTDLCVQISVLYFPVFLKISMLVNSRKPYVISLALEDDS